MSLLGLDLLPPGRREARQAFWLATGVWAAACLLEVAPQLLTGHHLARSVMLADTVCSFLGVGLSCALAYLGHASAGLGMARRAILVMLGASLAAALLVGLDQVIVAPTSDLLLPGQLARANPTTAVSSILDFVFYLWIFGFYGVVVLLLEANRIAQERARRLAEADAAAQASQLAALRFQLNPHFLFNTLNALSAMVVTGRRKEAELMIERLSSFLRTTLASGFKDETSLQDELGLLEAYLEIESIRFQDRLSFEVDAPEDLLEAQVPSLILQPLVENSIKYAVSTAISPVELRVLVSRDAQDLVLVVSDDGCSALSPPAQPGVGVGLENVAARLRALYGSAARMTCEATAAGFRTELRLPLRRSAAAPGDDRLGRAPMLAAAE